MFPFFSSILYLVFLFLYFSIFIWRHGNSKRGEKRPNPKRRRGGRGRQQKRPQPEPERPNKFKLEKNRRRKPISGRQRGRVSKRDRIFFLPNFAHFLWQNGQKLRSHCYFKTLILFKLQVILFQEHSFLYQLTQNITSSVQENYKFSRCCVHQIVLNVKTKNNFDETHHVLDF